MFNYVALYIGDLIWFFGIFVVCLEFAVCVFWVCVCVSLECVCVFRVCLLCGWAWGTVCMWEVVVGGLGFVGLPHPMKKIGCS